METIEQYMQLYIHFLPDVELKLIKILFYSSGIFIYLDTLIYILKTNV